MVYANSRTLFKLECLNKLLLKILYSNLDFDLTYLFLTQLATEKSGVAQLDSSLSNSLIIQCIYSLKQ